MGGIGKGANPISKEVDGSEVSILTYCAKLSCRKTGRAIAFIAGFANHKVRS